MRALKQQQQAAARASTAEEALRAHLQALHVYLSLPGAPPQLRFGPAPSRTTRAACYRSDSDVIEVFHPPTEPTPAADRRGLCLRGPSGVAEALTEALVDRAWCLLAGPDGRAALYGRRPRGWRKLAAETGLALGPEGQVLGIGARLIRWIEGPGAASCPSATLLASVARRRTRSRLLRYRCACPGLVYSTRPVTLHCTRCKEALKS